MIGKGSFKTTYLAINFGPHIEEFKNLITENNNSKMDSHKDEDPVNELHTNIKKLMNDNSDICLVAWQDLTLNKDSVDEQRIRNAINISENINKDPNQKYLLQYLHYKIHTDGEKTHIILITPYYQLGDLDHFIKNYSDSITLDLIFCWIKQLLEILKLFEEKNIVHRDMKPQNILVNKNLDLIVIDLDLATKFVEKSRGGSMLIKTITDSTINKTSHLKSYRGTPTYSSPETASITSQKVSIKTDVYALGIIFMYLLLNKPFYQRDYGNGFYNLINKEHGKEQDLLSKMASFNDFIFRNCYGKNRSSLNLEWRKNYELMESLLDTDGVCSLEKEIYRLKNINLNFKKIFKLYGDLIENTYYRKKPSEILRTFNQYIIDCDDIQSEIIDAINSKKPPSDEILKQFREYYETEKKKYLENGETIKLMKVYQKKSGPNPFADNGESIPDSESESYDSDSDTDRTFKYSID